MRLLRTAVRASLGAVVLVSSVSVSALAQRSAGPSGATVRAAARQYREDHEAEIAREFADLLSLPNVASDSVAIRRNTAAVIELLRRRGVTARALEGRGGPPAVYGELRTPGATRTVVFYAHYDPFTKSTMTGVDR